MSMPWVQGLLWGFSATLVLTIIMSLSQGLGWSRISVPYLLGTAFTPRRAAAMWIGSALHLVVGTGFALIYLAIFSTMGMANAWLGALLGLLHAAFVVLPGMEVLADLHPRMAGRHRGPTPTRHLEPPGFLGMNYGRMSPLLTVIAHVIYGTLLGFLYGRFTLVNGSCTCA